MPADKWGIPLFHPSKSNGFSYFQSDNILDDSNFSDEGHVTNSSGGQWTMTTSGPDAVQLAKNSTSATVIGGCNMDFAATASRGYAYKADDPRDIELKFLIKFVDSGSNNGFAIEASSGAHSSSGCCSGFSYKVDIAYQPSIPVFRFRKEMYHVTNSDDPKTGTFTDPLANFQLLGANYVGLGFCRYNLKDGVSTGNDAVALELWFNPNPLSNITNWTMIKRTVDTGGWGSGGNQCNGNSDQIGTWAVQKYRLKSNDTSGEFDFRHLSLREIDPTASFEDTPTEPPIGEEPEETTLVQGLFKLQWDINTLRSSPCAGSGTGGGSGSGNTKFYSVYTDQGTDSDKELSDSSTWQNRKRLVMSPANSSSVFSGKTPLQLDIPLKKVGTPGASPTVGAKIWDSSGTVVYTSPTTFDPSTFTTSYVLKTFDFSTNTHVLVTGDRIGVEYTGTSSSNYVVASYSGTAYPNTTYYQYEGTTWQSKSRRLTMDVWQ